MGSVHEELYARVKELFDNDQDPVRGLSKSGSAAYCRGGMYRMGDPERTKNWPWIEVRIATEEDLNNKDGSAFLCSVELRMHGNRDQNYGGNAGDIGLNIIAQRVREVYNDCAVSKNGVGSSGGNVYRISSFKRQAGSLAEVDGKEFVVVDRYRVLVSDKDRVVFQVYEPGEKTFYRGGFSGESRKFVVTDLPDLEAPPANIPHVGYADRLQIVKSVHRTRVLNRLDAEYVVRYEPLDFSFDEQQRRVEITTSSELQEVTLFKRIDRNDASGQTTWYLPQIVPFRRATMTRTVQVKKDLGRDYQNDVTLPLQSAIAADTNTYVTFDGIPYVFLGADVEYNTNTGLALVTAKFWTIGKVQGVDVGVSHGLTNSVVVPPLNYLEDYAITEAVNTPSGLIPPTISVKPYLEIYEEGDFSWL